HFLLGNGDHLLHHVDLAADAVEIGRDQIEARRKRAGVFAETFDGPVIALRHGLDAGKQRDDDEQHKCNRENVETAHKSSKAGKGFPAPYPRQTLGNECRFLLSAKQQCRFSRLLLQLYVWSGLAICQMSGLRTAAKWSFRLRKRAISTRRVI